MCIYRRVERQPSNPAITQQPSYNPAITQNKKMEQNHDKYKGNTCIIWYIICSCNQGQNEQWKVPATIHVFTHVALCLSTGTNFV